MLKDLVELKAIVDDAMVVFRGRDRNTCIRLALKAGAMVNLPYSSIYCACAQGARRTRAAIKRNLRRQARHTGIVYPKCLFWKLT